jgi:hypothetical protein
LPNLAQTFCTYITQTVYTFRPILVFGLILPNKLIAYFSFKLVSILISYQSKIFLSNKTLPHLTSLKTLNFFVSNPGDAVLEYSCFAFNTEQQLAGLSGVPDYKLTLWDWTKGVKLHSVNTSIKVVWCTIIGLVIFPKFSKE